MTDALPQGGVQNPAYRGTAFFKKQKITTVGRRVNQILQFFTKDIWRITQGDVSPLRFLLLEVVKKLMLAVRFFTAKRVLTKASALTYSTLLAIVPILAVVFAIARGFGYNKYIEVWFRDAFKSQPQVADVIIGLSTVI